MSDRSRSTHGAGCRCAHCRMTDGPTPIADDMRIVAAIANKMLEWNQDGLPKKYPTHVAVHTSHLRRYTEILGLLVCHVPEMEPGTAALLVGERSSANPGVVVRIDNA